MRNINKLTEKEMKMKTIVLENNHIENEINEFYDTNNND